MKQTEYTKRRGGVKPGVIFVMVGMGIVGILLISKMTAGPPMDAAVAGDFEAALAQSAETGKPVVVVFTASWCPPCKKMKKYAWPDARVQQLLTDSYHRVVIDTDNRETAAVAQRYAVEYIPTIVIVDSTGRTLLRSGSMDADELAAFLQQGAGRAG